MKLFFLLFMLGLSGSKLHAQLLDQKAEWFELESYFNPSFIQKSDIEAIHIKIEDKADGETIRNNGRFLHYEFNSDGMLNLALKSVEVANGLDTSTNSYCYDPRGRLKQKEERFGPFLFIHQYAYDSTDKLVKEYKIDGAQNRNDTLHLRHFYHLKEGNSTTFQTANEKGIAFKEEQFEYIENDQERLLMRYRMSYKRARRTFEKRFNYHKGLLSSIQMETNLAQDGNEYIKFFFKNERLDEVKYFKNGEMTYKRVFIYQENELIRTVVERDYQGKKVRLYHFLYHFR